jgi:hypothetical protein
VGLPEETLKTRPAYDGIVLTELLDHPLPHLLCVGRFIADRAQVE